MDFVETRKIDELGRVVLPEQARKLLAIESGMELNFYYENHKIILQKKDPVCIFCNSGNHLKKTHKYNTYICLDCLKDIKNL